MGKARSSLCFSCSLLSFPYDTWDWKTELSIFIHFAGRFEPCNLEYSQKPNGFQERLAPLNGLNATVFEWISSNWAWILYQPFPKELILVSWCWGLWYSKHTRIVFTSASNKKCSTNTLSSRSQMCRTIFKYKFMIKVTLWCRNSFYCFRGGGWSSSSGYLIYHRFVCVSRSGHSCERKD